MAEGTFSEPVAAPVEGPPPGGWLAELQRSRCAGRTPLDVYQGLVADEIVLPDTSVNHADPVHTVLACSAWAEAMLEQAHFIPGEFAPEALWSYYANDYLTQAKAGGHAQYFAARGQNEIALRCCSSALKSMLADPHFEIFDLMVRLKKSNRQTAQKLAKQKGYRDATAALRDLDKRLADVEAKEPLLARHKTWLKSLRKLKVVPDAEMSQHLNRIATSNRLFQQRRQEAARIRAEHEKSDPIYVSAKALCEMAGLRFAGLHTGMFAAMQSIWPEGPNRPAFIFRIETDRGPRGAAYYVEGGLFKKRLAVLIEHNNSLPVGSLTLSKSDYDAIVPHV